MWVLETQTWCIGKLVLIGDRCRAPCRLSGSFLFLLFCACDNLRSSSRCLTILSKVWFKLQFPVSIDFKKTKHPNLMQHIYVVWLWSYLTEKKYSVFLSLRFLILTEGNLIIIWGVFNIWLRDATSAKDTWRAFFLLLPWEPSFFPHCSQWWVYLCPWGL